MEEKIMAPYIRHILDDSRKMGVKMSDPGSLSIKEATIKYRDVLDSLGREMRVVDPSRRLIVAMFHDLGWTRHFPGYNNSLLLAPTPQNKKPTLVSLNKG